MAKSPSSLAAEPDKKGWLKYRVLVQIHGLTDLVIPVGAIIELDPESKDTIIWLKQMVIELVKETPPEPA